MTPTVVDLWTDRRLRRTWHWWNFQALLIAPTYRIEPKKKFDVDAVKLLLKEFMDKHCSEFSYSEKECQNSCKRISYYIRRAVKQLSFDRWHLNKLFNKHRGLRSWWLFYCLVFRYRFICQVRIIEKQSQGVETQTAFLWDENFDGYATYTVDTYSFIAQAVVYGVYKDWSSSDTGKHCCVYELFNCWRII